MIKDEFFVPTLGLNVLNYINAEDLTGTHHLLRYEWAIKTMAILGPSKSILDVACGSGFGSYMIAKNFPATQVLGVDYDPVAVDYAKRNYFLSNLSFKEADITKWDETIGKNVFSQMVSFDTIEHISHREIAMENFVNHLQKDGSLFLSTPCAGPINILKPDWEFHKIEYSTASLYDFLKRYFNTITAPENPNFPNRNVFDILKGSKVDYVLRLNPVLCQNPILISNQYRLE